MAPSTLVGLCLITCSLAGSAQSVSDRSDNPRPRSGSVHVHSMATSATSTTVIDGSQHPELISDLTAYRLVLLTISEVPNPTSEQKARQEVFLKASGFDVDDLEAATPVLSSFRTQYLDMVERYNESIAVASSEDIQAQRMTFLHQRDALVQWTRDALAKAVTMASIVRFAAYVQSEKARMTVAKVDQ